MITLPAIAFYLFASVTVLSGVLVITSRNPVHSVLWLILAFFSAAGLFVLMGAEFLAMLLVIVYVGAVAVLFLFVVMMLDIDFSALRASYTEYLPIGLTITLALLVEVITLVSAWKFGPQVVSNVANKTPDVGVMDNTQALGNLIYTDYIFIFQGAGMVLLVAMIGAIVLTHRTRSGVKRQNISAQNARHGDEAFEIVDVKSGEGI